MNQHLQNQRQPERAAGQPVRVDVYAARAGDVVAFNHRWRDRADQRKKGPIEIPNGASCVRIQFHLNDRTGLNLRFCGAGHGNPGDAFWVDSTGCPTQPSTDPQTPVSDFHVTPSQLTVVDRNSGEPCTLHFVLRFTGDPTPEDGPIYEYDPEIRNGGGGID
ncbi:MAG TPA: hypothetical protein VNH53_06945 [Sphingomicrobium sp.]|jgi:hypothetical protein|nr:hypothetical protein [Sphingomicrobium sp.]